MNSREVCEIRRTSTNTPLQALVTLNDPVYVEAAQALARRIVTSSAATSLAHQVALAFELCLIRRPTQSEQYRLEQLAHETKRHFEADQSAAKLLATDSRHPPGNEVDYVELATWTTIANVLLNLDEMVMKP